jgi:nitrogen regulatory protein PII
MKMVMIFYNEAIDMEVMEALGKCGIKNYTKILSAYGKGEASGTHLGNDIWPGRNNILYVACDESQKNKLLSCIKELRKTLGKEGLKAFVLPLEELT